MTSPTNFLQSLIEFEKREGRRPTEQEKAQLKLDFHRKFWIEKTRQAGVDVDSLNEDQLQDAIAQTIKDHEMSVIQERQEELRIMGKTDTSELERKMSYFMSTVPPRYKDADLSDFNSGARIVNHILSGGSCLILGPTGVGKTRLMYAIGKSLVKTFGYGEIEIDTLTMLISGIRSNSGSQDWADYAHEHYGVRTSLLIVDELDKIKGNRSDYEIINLIIGERYDHKLQTVLVGNGTLDEAREILGDASISRLIGDKEGGMLFNLSSSSPDRRFK